MPYNGYITVARLPKNKIQENSFKKTPHRAASPIELSRSCHSRALSVVYKVSLYEHDVHIHMLV